MWGVDQGAVSEASSGNVSLLTFSTQIHSMAFALMAVYFVYGMKQIRNHPSGIWNFALIFCLFAYTIRAMLVDYAPSVAHVFNSVEYMTPVFFMICVRVNFDDDFVFGWVEKSALVIVGSLAFLFAIYEYIGTSEVIYTLQMRSQFGLDALAVIWAYWSVIHTWAEDLMDRRRLARVFFVAGCGPVVAAGIALYFISITHTVEFALYVDLFISAAILVLGMMGVVFFTDVSPGLFSAGGNASNSESAPGGAPQAEFFPGSIQQESTIKDTDSEVELHSNQSFLYTLEQVMLGQARFKEMGMTLAVLAKYTEIPEYRLRSVINRDLGYRNFNAYLNHYRIAHACELLGQPKNQHSILDISMECGYKSLSTFNKAFKDITSFTPSEYRKKKA